MSWPPLALVLVTAHLVPWAALAAPPAPPEEAGHLTLSEAIALALRESPRVRATAAQVAQAEGALTGAGTLRYNPELALQGARRQVPGGSNLEFEVGIEQGFELAGQRGKRRAAAQEALRAARESRRRALHLLIAEVRLAFVDALEAREMLALARAEARLAEELLALAHRRLEAGAGTLLDTNVAAAELGRAEQRVGALVGDEAAARAGLAQVLGLPADTLPRPVGTLAPSEEALPPLPELLESARENRADLRALRERAQETRTRVALARSEGWPDLRVSGFVGQEEGTDTLVGVGLALPIPLFSRNQGEIAVARARVDRLAAELEGAKLSVIREVTTAFERHRAGLAVLKSLHARVLGNTEENLALLRKAFEGGKAGWTDVLVMRRTLFDVRRALISTRARVRRSRALLDAAAGRTTLPSDDDPGK